MKSFLVRGKKPVCKWGLLPDGVFFEGALPEGFSLAISPGGNYVVLDVDRHGKVDGFNSIPEDLKADLNKTLNYPTKNNGRHYWFKYTGDVDLPNKTSGVGIDLRVGDKGYVVWYPKDDVRNRLNEINETNKKVKKWLENLFYYKNQ